MVKCTVGFIVRLDATVESQSDDVSVGHRSVSHVGVGHSSVIHVSVGSTAGLGQSSQSNNGSQLRVAPGKSFVVVSTGHGHVTVGSSKSVVDVARHSANPYSETTESMQRRSVQVYSGNKGLTSDV